MAKRKVRQARVQGRAPGPPAPPPKPTRTSTFSTRQFWLGVLAAACILIPVAVVGMVLAGGGSDEGASEQAAQSQTPEPTAESEQARLQRISQTRDKEQVQDLTTRMRQWSDDLDPVVRGVAKTLPPESESKIGPLAGRAQVDDWLKTTRSAQSYFEESTSGDTGTNVARGMLASSIRGLAEMVETYKLALTQQGTRAALLERVRAQRDIALRTWETASIQMDVVNIAVGLGHQHPPAPGQGGTPPDELPEGTDATEGG